ncbi:phage regulatory CII family protein [Ralstonia mannitolilytica]|uniref:phage regulatory CII family protein n=1 Tax=Ralstonia mannitolilytica TaxID=105219 RepID=UPI0018F7EC96|nr:phage regulatory CII family protein [Ralstonia mannitolilytica]
MSHHYSEINQHDALYWVARGYPGGVEGLAARMDKSAAVLRNKLLPHVQTNYVSFEEVSVIVEHAEGAGVPNAKLPIQALCWRHGMVAIPLPEVAREDLPNTDLYEALCKVLAEVGDVSRAMSAALADNHVSEGEMRKLERDFEEATASVMVLRELLRVRAQRDAERLQRLRGKA